MRIAMIAAYVGAFALVQTDPARAVYADAAETESAVGHAFVGPASVIELAKLKAGGATGPGSTRGITSSAPGPCPPGSPPACREPPAPNKPPRGGPRHR